MKKIKLILIIIFISKILNAADIEGSVTFATSSNCCDGSITLTINGGYSPYEYKWEGPNNYTSSQKDISNLCPGDYYLTVTDASCGVAKLNFKVRSNYQEVELEDFGNVSDCGTDGSSNDACDGYLKLKQGNFTSFEWTGPNNFTSNNKFIKNLCNGDYTVKATLPNGCVIEQTFNVCCCSNGPQFTNTCQYSSINEIKYEKKLKPPTTQNSNDASVELIMENPNRAYHYNWSGPNGFSSSSKDNYNLGVGTYHFTITDGCTREFGNVIFRVCDNESVKINSPTIEHTCKDYAVGKITINATSDNLPLTYLWDNGLKSSIRTNLASDYYCVTVKDNGGCSSSACYWINEYPVTSLDVSAWETCKKVYFCNKTKVGEENYPVYEQVDGNDCLYTNYYCSLDNKLIQKIKNNYYISYEQVSKCVILAVCSKDFHVKTILGRLQTDRSSYNGFQCVKYTSCYYGELGITISDPTPIYSFPTTGGSGYNAFCPTKCGTALMCDGVQVGFKCDPIGTQSWCIAAPPHNEDKNTITFSKNDKILISPNPVTEILNVSILNPTNNIYKIDLLNLLGEILDNITISIESKLESNISFNMNKYNNGIYFLRLKNNNGVILSTEKLIKNNL